MKKGKMCIDTSTIIKLPNRMPIDCNCNKCNYFKKTVCELDRKLYPLKCKWFITIDDYKLNEIERKEVQEKDDADRIDRNIQKKNSEYQQGWGDIEVKSVDLSKYRK